MSGEKRHGNSRNAMRIGMVFLSFVILLIAAAVWNLRSGSVSIPVRDIVRILSGNGDPESTAYSGSPPVTAVRAASTPMNDTGAASDIMRLAAR